MAQKPKNGQIVRKSNWCYGEVDIETIRSYFVETKPNKHSSLRKGGNETTTDARNNK